MSATTLEFYKSGESFYVIYNLKKMEFTEFSNLDGSKILILKMCKTILNTYGNENPCEDKKCLQEARINRNINCCCAEITGKFIKKHLLKYDRTLDVIISEDSDHVVFNLEE
jgi:hypothetical protein